MSKTFLIILFVSISYFAQEQQIIEEPKTKLEKFFSKEGVLLIKEFLERQTLSGNSATQLTFQGLKVYYSSDEKSITKGLKINIASYKKEADVFLDIDEIESLQKAMEYIWNQSSILKQQTNYTEIIFSTKDDFKFGCYVKEKEIILFATTDKYPYPAFYADFDQLNTLRMIVANYLKILQ